VKKARRAGQPNHIPPDLSQRVATNSGMARSAPFLLCLQTLIPAATIVKGCRPTTGLNSNELEV
jgi:hypothetical protein